MRPGDLLFGRFRVREELGRGGMGIVFKATDETFDNKVVAVKVLAPHLAADPSAVARLKQEVDTAQGLQHPGIVRINTFHAEQGQAGFDMEYLEGAPLAEHIAGDVPGSPFTPPATIDRLPWVAYVVAQLAVVLDFIHAEHLVHRDIKPSNVMLVPRDDGGFTVKLLDFGIVHVEGGDLTGVAQPGTMSYMAPELINGTREASPASDLFALGKLVYLALTDTPAKFGPESDPPSSLVAGLPSSVDEPVLSCLAARPDRRSQTAGLLAEAIRAAVAQVEEEARKAEKACKTEEAGRAEEARKVEAAGKAEEARKAEEAPRKEEELRERYGLIRIEPGTFQMGSPEEEVGRRDNEALHEVRITHPFELGRAPVIQALWKSLVGDNPSSYKGDDRPVEQVSWLDCVGFCNALSEREGLRPAYLVNGDEVSWDRSSNGFRLPTEAEWEYAARAGQRHRFAGSNDLNAVAVWNRFGKKRGRLFKKAEKICLGTAPVCSKRPNTWGLYDMTGNVNEWCWDDYSRFSATFFSDPVGNSSHFNQVTRGGSWGSDLRSLRVAYRGWCTPSFGSPSLGFRLARDVP